MRASEFVASFSKRSYSAWENAVLDEARSGQLLPVGYTELVLRADDHEARVRVRADQLSIGVPGDSMRMPLTPERAQDILNLTGELLPTPLICWQFWRQSTQLTPFSEAPNRGANLPQYLAHSRGIDQLAAATGKTSFPTGLGGTKKNIIVSNIYQPKKVLIFGWYRPSPPYPDVLDDKRPMEAAGRQPLQPKSNVHGDFYVDYSHGVQGVHPECIVDGRPREIEEIYRDPILSKLVSSEGPVRVPRYPSKVPVGSGRVSIASSTLTTNARQTFFVATQPSLSDAGLERVLEARGVFSPTAGRRRA